MSDPSADELDEIIAVALRLQAEAREVDPSTLKVEDIAPEWFEAAAAEVAAAAAAAEAAATPHAPAPAPPAPVSSGALWGFAGGLVLLFAVCGVGVAVLVGGMGVFQAQQRVERVQVEAEAAVEAAWAALGGTRDATVPLSEQGRALSERASALSAPDAPPPAHTEVTAATEALSTWKDARDALDEAVAQPPGAWACAVGLVTCP